MSSRKDNDPTTGSGGCGESGLCPGQALLLSIVTAYALHSFTGWSWAVPIVVVVGTLALVLGWHRYLNPFGWVARK